jgi:hypothetical protein
MMVIIGAQNDLRGAESREDEENGNSFERNKLEGSKL